MANDSSITFGLRISKAMDRSIEAQAKRLGKTKATVMRDAFEFYEHEQRIEAAIEKRMAKFRDEIIEESARRLDPILDAVAQILDEMEQKK